MRIAIIAGPHYPVPPRLYGGTERVIAFLVRGLLELGHEPILLAPGDSTVDCELVPICDAAIGFPRTGGATALGDAGTVTFRDVPNVTTLHGAIGFDNLSLFRARRDLYYVSVSRNQQAGFPSLNYLE